MGKLIRNFSYTFNGKIWNIISHPQQELLLLEVRQHEKFMATFSLLDTATGEFLMHETEFEEKWWIGASFITGNIIVFHDYPDQDNPDIKNIFVYDFISEKVLWEIKNSTLLDVNEHFAAVLHAGDELAEYYDLETGMKMETTATGKVDDPVKNKMMGETFHYREGGPHFDTVRKFLERTANKSVVKGVDYYENSKVIVISYYYLNENGKLDNDLLVTDHDGQALLNIRLGSDLDGISNDTFFIYYNKLIFVKDKTEFLIYQLP